MMNRRLLYAVLFAIFIGAALLWSSIAQVPDSGAGAEQAIRSVVTEFGEQLQRVSLLANKEELQQQIRAAYAPYVSDELLSAWLEDPTTAPGRLTSSPWPNRIEITGIDATDRTYTVAATIVLMTSAEVASAENDNAGEHLVTITVANVGGEWIITAFDRRGADEDGEGKIYVDPANGFTLRYPEGVFAVLRAGDEDTVRAGHYIPPCDDGFAACFVYIADTYATTNLDSAGVGVFMTDAPDMRACAATQHGAMQQNLHRDTLNGHEFTVFESGTAAMSHVARDTVYLTWHHDRCYQLVTRIGYSRFEVYEPGTIDQFSDEAMSQLQDALHSVTTTFEVLP